MSPLRLSTVLMSAMLAAAVLPVAGSHAFAQLLNSANRDAPIQQNELQSLQNSLQRQQFQQQQQQFRAQDREIVPQPRPVVPQVKPTCQMQIIGTTVVSNCR
jgi:hypothetical protein